MEGGKERGVKGEKKREKREERGNKEGGWGGSVIELEEGEKDAFPITRRDLCGQLCSNLCEVTALQCPLVCMPCM